MHFVPNLLVLTFYFILEVSCLLLPVLLFFVGGCCFIIKEAIANREGFFLLSFCFEFKIKVFTFLLIVLWFVLWARRSSDLEPTQLLDFFAWTHALFLLLIILSKKICFFFFSWKGLFCFSCWRFFHDSRFLQIYQLNASGQHDSPRKRTSLDSFECWYQLPSYS